MKYIITESKYHDVIINYLDKAVHPDYGWNWEFYRDEIDNYGACDFHINDIVGYSYFGVYGGRDDSEYMYLLLLTPWLSEQLNSLFGPLWKPIFKEWFEKNSGLEVKRMETGNSWDISYQED